VGADPRAVRRAWWRSSAATCHARCAPTCSLRTAWVGAAFYLFILATSNPCLRIASRRFEGRELNPILQDVGLALHPPLLYLGYVGFSISFAFAVAALIEGTHRRRLGRAGCGTWT